ncbi:MAG: hypothetical protein IT318_08315 [Anaerolineales bacterium]|nr:hypothetical protein [Anaerolineales bacterium]
MEPRTASKPTLADLLRDIRPSVSVVQWAYRVDYGSGVRPRWHTVSKERRCQCLLGAECPAVPAVAEYLRAGGQRAPDPPFDFWPSVPEACPICGGQTVADPGLFSREHGDGWRCAETGGLCYWAARAVPLMVAKPARLYVVPPPDAVRSDDVMDLDASRTVLQVVVEKVRTWVADITEQPAPHNRAHYPGITIEELLAAREAAWAAERYAPDN